MVEKACFNCEYEEIEEFERKFEMTAYEVREDDL